MKLLLTFLALSFCHSTWAQMTLPSAFPDMRNANPAVIPLRTSGHLKLAYQKDSVKRKQSILADDDFPFSGNQKDEVELNTINAFIGGKGGGATSEFSFDGTSGKQRSNFVLDGESNHFDVNASSYLIKYALGFDSRWGLELLYMGYKSDYDIDFVLGGDPTNISIEQKSSAPGIKLGTIIGDPSLSLGLTFQYSALKVETKGADEDTDDETEPLSIFGVGLGTGGTDGLLELAMEFDPISNQDQDDLMPMKFSFIAEARIESLVLGYKGMLFRGNFIELDKIIQDQLIYQYSGESTRLEHMFNFSFGAKEGFTFGGNLSFANTSTKEYSSIFETTKKNPTKTSYITVGVRAGYSY